MTPTDAQISAAKIGVRDEYGSHLCMWRDTGERVCRKEFNESCLCEQIAKAALTAAAGVEPLPSVNFKDGKPYSYCPECGRDESYLDDRTIERCAQVAKDRADFWHKRAGGQPAAMTLGDECEAIFAAIRALKDKPVSDAFGGPFPEEEP